MAPRRGSVRGCRSRRCVTSLRSFRRSTKRLLLRRRGARDRPARRPQAADAGSTSWRRRSCGTDSRNAPSSAACTCPSLRAVARAAPGVRIGITYPEDRLSISRKPYLWPIVSLGLTSMRASVPLRLPRLARRVGASAVMLQHRLVTESSVERAHAAGPARPGLDRRRACRARPRRRGRHRRRDHERSPDLRGYTEVVNRGVTIAALSACGAAGAIVAVLLATAPSAGADEGDDHGTPTTPPARRRR